MNRDTRPVSWVKAARKQFDKFPASARGRLATALTIAAEGQLSDIAKPMKGLGSGVIEIALRHSSGAYRVIYVTEFEDSLWVIHAFQKKSKTGIKTPKFEMDVVRERLNRLRRELQQ